MQRKAVEADNRVHGRADFVAHVGEEYGLRLARLFCRLERIGKGLVLGKGIAHFLVDIGKSETYNAERCIRGVAGIVHARHAQHFVTFLAAMVC